MPADDRLPLPGLPRQRLAVVRRHARSGDRPGARRAGSASPICCWWSAPAWTSRRPAATRLIEAPRPRQALIHVHADPDELGRVFEPALGICASSAEFVAAAIASSRLTARGLRTLDRCRGEPTRSRSGRQATPAPGARPGPRDLRACGHGSGPRRSSPTAPATTRCGSIATGLHRFGAQLAPCQRLDGLRTTGRDRREADRARTPGGLLRRRRRACRWAARSSPPPCATRPIVVFVVIDNASYGTIRMHQERRYPGRPVGTELRTRTSSRSPARSGWRHAR